MREAGRGRRLGWALGMFLAVAVLGLTVVTSAEAATDDPLDERLNMELAGAPAGEVISSLAEIAALELKLDPAVAGREVTFSVRQVSIRTILKVICESIGCIWFVRPGGDGLLVVRDQGEQKPIRGTFEERLQDRLDLALDGAAFRDVAQSMGMMLGIPVQVDDSLAERPITITADQVTPGDFLDSLCEMAECDWEFVKGEGPTPTLRITPSG